MLPMVKGGNECCQANVQSYLAFTTNFRIFRYKRGRRKPVASFSRGNMTYKSSFVVYRRYLKGIACFFWQKSIIAGYFGIFPQSYAFFMDIHRDFADPHSFYSYNDCLM